MGASPRDMLPAVVDGVSVLRWPADAEPARTRAGLPRVLVVAGDASPPLVWDDTEDWIRPHLTPAQVDARAGRLPSQAAVGSEGGSCERRRAARRPALDADGIVRGPGGWAAIPPIEARLLAALIDRIDHVVRRTDLHRSGWPGGNVGQRALDSRIKLLRRRVAPVGIAIRTVRGLGFLLEVERS